MLNRLYAQSILVGALVGVSCAVSAQTVSIATRYGTLTTNSEDLLTYKGRPIKPEVAVFSSAYVLNTLKLATSDVVLISQAAGNSCPGMYVFVTVDAQGVKVTPPFGTCYDDPVQPTLVGESIAFSMKKMGGKGSSRYIYERGVVFEDGKPVK